MNPTPLTGAVQRDSALTNPRAVSPSERRYLQLLKEVIIDVDNAHRFQLTPYPPDRSYWLKRTAINSLINTLSKKGLTITGVNARGATDREIGLGWPINGYSMIGMKRLNNIQYCLEQVFADVIPGDFIETGVWRGGACIFARAICEVYNENRNIWVADSFEGLPKPNVELYPEDKGDDLYSIEQLRVSLEQVQENFKRFDLLDDKVHFLKGWFKDTLPSAPIEKLAVVRLDGDMYESTMDALKSLYPKLSTGGFLIVDDYGVIPACRKAVHDYRDEHGITDEIIDIDGSGHFWRKSGN